MGMFDTVLVPCPKCGTENEFQTKSGPCILNYYKLDEAPPEVVAGIIGDQRECDSCATVYEVMVKMLAIPVVSTWR